MGDSVRRRRRSYGRRQRRHYRLWIGRDLDDRQLGRDRRETFCDRISERNDVSSRRRIVGNAFWRRRRIWWAYIRDSFRRERNIHYPGYRELSTSFSHRRRRRWRWRRPTSDNRFGRWWRRKRRRCFVVRSCFLLRRNRSGFECHHRISRNGRKPSNR